MVFKMLFLADYIEDVDRKKFNIPDGRIIYYTKVFFDYDFLRRCHCVKLSVTYSANINSYTKSLWFTQDNFLKYYRKCENYQRFKKLSKINNAA